MKQELAIEFDKVTKRYFKGKRYQPSFRDWMGAVATGKSFSKPTFKALDNVSFKIKKGQVIGFIGSNGAGKSTLLKLMSRITAPNEGTIKMSGSVAGLLELGTGFHPELTGEENVFIYGSILGLKRKRIEELYPKIVDFAGISEFMDTPIKHYSSGMLARLGFSVAIHIEPDILLIDEVLAVGDMHFQKKCMKFMTDYCKDPRHTVVFVSHSNQNVRKICNELIWLEHGKVKKIGPTDELLKDYIDFQNERTD